jgi:hypothetical protein
MAVVVLRDTLAQVVTEVLHTAQALRRRLAAVVVAAALADTAFVIHALMVETVAQAAAASEYMALALPARAAC